MRLLIFPGLGPEPTLEVEDSFQVLLLLRPHPYSLLATLSPTFLSWLKNLNLFTTLINQLSMETPNHSQECRPLLSRQVSALRAGLRKQQERCVSFLRLSSEYADRFLSDISEEIQQQSAFLEALEKRIEMAKTLREEVVHLRKSYEVGTLDCIKKVRRTGVCIFAPCLIVDTRNTYLQAYPNHSRKMSTYSGRWILS